MANRTNEEMDLPALIRYEIEVTKCFFEFTIFGRAFVEACMKDIKLEKPEN